MDNQAIYTRTDSGLNQFYAKIYSLVGMGIGLSAFVSYLMLYPFRANLISIIGAHPWVYYGATIIELILVFVSSSAAQKIHQLLYRSFDFLSLKWIYFKFYHCSLCTNDSASSLFIFSCGILCNGCYWL